MSEEKKQKLKEYQKKKKYREAKKKPQYKNELIVYNKQKIVFFNCDLIVYVLFNPYVQTN